MTAEKATKRFKLVRICLKKALASETLFGQLDLFSKTASGGDPLVWVQHTVTGAGDNLDHISNVEKRS